MSDGRVEVSEPKNRLSLCLRRVRCGATLLVCIRGRVIARLEPVQSCHLVVNIEHVKSQARRLLRLHPLRAADALQVAAAVEWAGGRPHGHTLHTLDGRLAGAARREGFEVPA